MIWKRLSKSYLQSKIGESLLERLEKIIPALQGSDTNPNEIYRKKSLVKIFTAFTTSQIFKDKHFLKTFLNHLTAEELHRIYSKTNLSSQAKEFDERVKVILRKGWNEVEYCRHFLEAIDLPTTYLPVQLEKPPREEKLDAADVPYKILKDFQFQIYLESIKELKIPRSRFIVQMPTGSGKTRTSMEFITQFLNESPEGSTILWLAHSEELCEQSIVCFKDAWTHVGKREIKLFRVWGDGGTLPFDFTESAFIVGGFQKMYSLLNKDKESFKNLRNRIMLLIIDEAHKVIAPTYKIVTKVLIGNNTNVVGLTATPSRGVDKFEENQELSEFFFNRILTIQTEPNQSVLSLLRSKSILSNVKIEQLMTNRSYELTEQQKRFIENKFDFPAGFLNTLAIDDIRNLEIIKKLEQECKQGRRVIFFACSIEHSKFICSLLIYLGISVAHIDGSTDRNMRQMLLRDYKATKIQVICNYGILSTGFDAPQTDLVFISRPTRSLVLYSQMIGRGLRGPAIGGTEKCKIINVKDNIIGLPSDDDIFDYFRDYFD